MRLRRCAVLMIELRERLEFDLAALSGQGDGLRRVTGFVALIPHLCKEIDLSAEALVALGAFSSSKWIDVREASQHHPEALLQDLLEKGLWIAEGSDVAARDELLRETHWRATSAVAHYASRWNGVDTEAVQQRLAESLDGDLLDRLGPAPPTVHEQTPASERIALPRAPRTPLDTLLDGRVTCRNFDPNRSLTMEQFAAVLYRAFGARAVDDYAPGVELLKKGVPSAGGLHPTEAYLLIRRVEGIVPGLYHYHPVDHALEPILPLASADLSALSRTFVGAQSYFLDAQVFVIPVSRFRRNFWKYRNHAKAYRAVILDAGHLSQTMYLAATELGLAAFITAAVNEVDIEQAFGLDPLEEGPLAVCGFGIRAALQSEVEFDPLHSVWKGD